MATPATPLLFGGRASLRHRHNLTGLEAATPASTRHSAKDAQADQRADAAVGGLQRGAWCLLHGDDNLNRRGQEHVQQATCRRVRAHMGADGLPVSANTVQFSGRRLFRCCDSNVPVQEKLKPLGAVSERTRHDGLRVWAAEANRDSSRLQNTGRDLDVDPDHPAASVIPSFRNSKQASEFVGL